ncbi:MAG: oligoendopeptidase F [Spirochaetota bacterium]|nr:oligoendopeptidase F [Spirochaetota bacterium]
MKDEKRSIPKRSEIDESYKWDLTPLFTCDEDWEKLFSEIEKQIEKFNDFKGRLSESAEVLKEAIEFDLEISRKLESLYSYAHLRSDEDKTNQTYQELYQRAITLNSKISELTSYMTPEIQSIDDEKLNEFLNDEGLAKYKFMMEKILRFKPHTLSKEVEEALAITGEIAHAPSQFFSQLDNADLRFGELEDEDGNIVELSHGNFSSFLQSSEREIRKKAFFQYYKSYEDHKYSIATALSYSTKKDFIYSRLRKFESCQMASLFSDKMPQEVYDNLLNTVKENLPSLFKYLSLRKRVLGVDELHFYDTYVPLLSDIKFHMPYEEAVDTCIKSLKPLGDEYCKILKKGLLGGWVDRYENRGKRSGAYSSGSYDSPPYILMNYSDDNINSLYTLIHEAGHSMHTYYSCKNQPYHYYGYTIFVAEVASTFNETLLSRYLLNYYKDDEKMKAYIFTREIDNIRGTLFRQTMFADFEKKSHNLIENNNPLTLDTFTDIYNDLLKTYFGDSIVIDAPLVLECLRIPHFYSPFYVYKYATGISAAIALVKKVLEEGDTSRDKYLNFLKLGGCKYPLDELLDAGVDMRKPEPIINAIHYFEDLVDKLAELL